MVSKKTILSYEFECIEDYFQYIVESRLNGQITQARTLYNKLSAKQKKAFWEWFDVSYYYDATDNSEPNYVADLKSILTNQ